ncbi:hypothetical protein ACQUFY_12060 [Robbsia andropogonis]|uniref:hypothetical protein n=1 Tax=Robbsia andropogonis TaxID=28092 RepID=UPI003D1A33A3
MEKVKIFVGVIVTPLLRPLIEGLELSIKPVECHQPDSSVQFLDVCLVSCTKIHLDEAGFLRLEFDAATRKRTEGAASMAIPTQAVAWVLHADAESKPPIGFQ